MDLPFGTHRNLIQPLTGDVHIKLILIRRFLCFIDKVENCKKDALKMLMIEAKKDVRSITGSNFRNIMILMGKSTLEDINLRDVDSLTYFKLEDDEKWKITAIREIVDTKLGLMDIPGFDLEELETLLSYLCTE